MPSKPSHVEITSVGSQSDNRALVTFRDQHKSTTSRAFYPDGRPFWGYFEMPSDPKQPPGSICELHPGDHESAANRDWSQCWNAPWLPSAKYMEINPRKMTVFINYPRMIADFKTAMETHYEKASQVAYEKNWPEPQWLGPIDHNIAHVIGKVPMSHKIPEAAMAGDPWILGFSDEPNEKLQKLLFQANDQGIWDREEYIDPPPFQPTTTITTNIDELVAQKVAEALANMSQASKPKGASADNLAKARAAKLAKAGAQSAPAMG